MPTLRLRIGPSCDADATGQPDLHLRAKPIGTVEHAYSHGALDLTRKVLDLAQAWIDKEGLGT